jgi:hypothetical protein
MDDLWSATVSGTPTVCVQTTTVQTTAQAVTLPQTTQASNVVPSSAIPATTAHPSSGNTNQVQGSSRF